MYLKINCLEMWLSTATELWWHNQSTENKNESVIKCVTHCANKKLFVK